MEYTNRELLREGQERLRAAGIAEADVDAWILFTGTTGLDRTAYLCREMKRFSLNLPKGILKR